MFKMFDEWSLLFLERSLSDHRKVFLPFLDYVYCVLSFFAEYRACKWILCFRKWLLGVILSLCSDLQSRDKSVSAAVLPEGLKGTAVFIYFILFLVDCFIVFHNFSVSIHFC